MKLIVSLVSIFLTCSAFTMRVQIKQEYDGHQWDIYIYPQEKDTTTYLLHKIYGHSTDEFYYLNGEDVTRFWAIWDSGKIIAKEETDIGKGRYLQSYFSSIPKSKSLSVNDSEEIDLSYFADGALKSCKHTYYKGNNYDKEEIEFDSLHSYYSQGMFKTVTLPHIDTIKSEDPETGREVTKIVRTDTSIKTGTWLKYNTENVVISRETYP